MSSRHAAATLLGADLWALADGDQGRLIEAIPLTTLPSAWSRRAAFRLRLSGGGLLKGCRFDSEREAKRFAALLPLLDRRHFPGLVATRGAAALLEWADGGPLEAEQCRPGLMEEMGAVHAELHLRALPCRRRREGPDVTDWPDRLARYLDELISLAALDRATRDRAETLALSALPDRFLTALVHKDFCRENMVVSPGGVVRVVDNETLAVDCPDYDLARTWYRWPMEPDRAEAYLRGYQRHRSLHTLERDFPFWAVAVLAESALFRLRRGISAAALPIARLCVLVRRHAESGCRPSFVDRRPARADDPWR